MPLIINRKTFYTISEACKLAGSNRGTFLRWVREGKLADVQQRDKNGWRLFNTNDVRRLRAMVNRISKVKVDASWADLK